MTTRRPGADRAAASGAAVGITFLTGVAGGLAQADAPYPRPESDAATIRRYFRGNPGPARFSVGGQLASAITLSRFTVSVVTLAGRSGRGARALQVTAAVGGAVAAASLATATACAGALTTSRADQDDRVVALHRRAFLAGGVAHGVGFGLLVGAIGIAGRRTAELPRPLTITALMSAAAGLLSPLYLRDQRAVWLIPIGRFSGLLITGITGARLARGT